METNNTLNNSNTPKFTAEEQRNIIIDEIRKRQTELSQNIKDDIIVNNCLNHILHEINSVFICPRFDLVLDYGLEYTLSSNDLTLAQKNIVIKELARISCSLMRFW